MSTWQEFLQAAPQIGSVFSRRLAACGSLAFLGTIRRDGSPRISPMEPRPHAGQLCIVGMPGTRKFDDLARDPRFTLHTASADPQLTDGDAKISGSVRELPDVDFHRGFAEQLFADTGFDIRDEIFPHFYVADITQASSVQIVDGEHLDITLWAEGGPERVVRKH